MFPFRNQFADVTHSCSINHLSIFYHLSSQFLNSMSIFNSHFQIPIFSSQFTCDSSCVILVFFFQFTHLHFDKITRLSYLVRQSCIYLTFFAFSLSFSDDISMVWFLMPLCLPTPDRTNFNSSGLYTEKPQLLRSCQPNSQPLPPTINERGI